MENNFNYDGFIASGDDPRNTDFVITGEMPSNEHLIAIGKVNVAFTKLEEVVSTCFSLLLGCEPELASIVADSLPTRERCDTLFHIFAYRFGSAEMIRSGKNVKQERKLKRLSNLFKRINDAVSMRNKIAHSIWAADTEDELKAHRLYWSKKRSQPGFPSTDYSMLSAEEILKQADFISEVRHELFLFFCKYFGGWIQERAKNEEGGLRLL